MHCLWIFFSVHGVSDDVLKMYLVTTLHCCKRQEYLSELRWNAAGEWHTRLRDSQNIVSARTLASLIPKGAIVLECSWSPIVIRCAQLQTKYPETSSLIATVEKLKVPNHNRRQTTTSALVPFYSTTLSVPWSYLSTLFTNNHSLRYRHILGNVFGKISTKCSSVPKAGFDLIWESID